MALLLQLTQKIQQGFMAVWIRWPRKEAKKDAQKAWNQVNPDGALDDTINQACDVWIPIFEAREPQYRPLLASWLRGERWTDEPPPSPKRTTITPPTVKSPTLMAVQQKDAMTKIRLLVEGGMDREAAKQQVYLELGWITEDQS